VARHVDQVDEQSVAFPIQCHIQETGAGHLHGTDTAR
jgi:hypothetical protein